jgi:putative ATPase
MELFDQAHSRDPRSTPLAERMRPARLADVVGQEHVVGPGTILERAIAADRVPSLILWGPPGTGKTTLARVIAQETRSTFVPFSAVMSGVPELRKILSAADEAKRFHGTRTIVFIDEIHRFSKSQQDALLPQAESGAITLIGATTENPSFAVNAALLSRARVFRLESLSPAAIETLLRRALEDTERGLGALHVTPAPAALAIIAEGASGDARRALDVLEFAAHFAVHRAAGTQADAQAQDSADLGHVLTEEAAHAGLASKPLLYDKNGEEHHNVVSAFIKSMRGSDPDAAIYWMMRMLEAGEDPLFVLRRMIIFASEDIGNADPRALELAVSADAAFARLGMPEGLFAMAQACVYLASVPKSNASYRAWTKAKQAVEAHGALPVPMKLRNAPTRAMKDWGYGEGYRYPHDEKGFAAGETYLPKELAGQRFYEPSGAGFEAKIKERLDSLRGPKDPDAT